MIKKYEDIPDHKKYLFFKNGKAKKSFCFCSESQFHSCLGLQCPFYEVGCGISNIGEFEKMRNDL